MNIKTFMKAVFTIALPIALQNLMSTTASMIDTIMIGSQGELAVAAVGICSQHSLQKLGHLGQVGLYDLSHRESPFIRFSSS